MRTQFSQLFNCLNRLIGKLSFGWQFPFWLTVLLIGISPATKAQPYVAWVKHYSPENGLAHREVNAILQDQQGFMWFGTKFGLNRFDGKIFIRYTKEGDGLAFDDIHSMAIDAAGNLWLMGAAGSANLAIFNPLTKQTVSFLEKFKEYKDATTWANLTSLVSSDNGTVFLTDYQTATLISYHPSTGLRSVRLPRFKTLGIFRATSHNTVWGIADEHTVVELTPDGRIIHEFNHGQNVVSWCFGQRNVGIDFFYTLYNPAQKDRHLFYSVDESGHRTQWSSSLLASINRYMGPVCYPLDTTGLLWDGISLRDSSNRLLLTIASQTSGETIENRSFYRDRSGQFWLGTSFGVYQIKLTKNNFHGLFSAQNAASGNGAAIRGITVIGNQVYANLEKFGLYTIPKQGGTPKNLYTHSVFAYGLAQDNEGNLLAGNGDQLIHYNPATKTYSILSVPQDSPIWALSPIDTARWIAGGPKGLWLVNTKTRQVTPYTEYHQFIELAQAHILHIAPDRNGTRWICATTGLYILDPVKGITARFSRADKGSFYLPAGSYQHFYQDKQGIHWLATANAGLIRWDRKQNRFQQFRRQDGLSNDNIYAVYGDQRGHLWLSSDYGIMRFDPVRQTTRTYFVQDGITHNEFNRIAHYQDKTGQLYFGGLNGITSFDPRQFVAEAPSASLPIRITAFRQFETDNHQPIDKTAELIQSNTIVIQPGDQTGVLEFALLNFSDAEKNVYAYRFDGLENDWRQQTESTLRLGNLPYGTYQLLIKGQAANGQWSANTLSIRVDVRRPVYLQTWFLVMVGLVALVSIWGWLKWRIWNHQQEQLRLQQEIRQATVRIEADKKLIEQQAKTLHQLNETQSRFFANISHEFRTPLTVILGMADTVKQKAAGDQELVLKQAGDQIERNGTNLLRLINQILDLSKLEAGEMKIQSLRADLIHFTRYVAESFQALAALKGIQLQYSTTQPSLVIDFDQDKLQIILSNLITNALKHTPANGQVQLQVATQSNWQPLDYSAFYEVVSPRQPEEGPWVLLRVRDNGIGIETNQLPLIFKRFYQQPIDTNTSQPISPQEGTGIGLSLVRELMRLMQGGLLIRSVPDQGTELVISLRQTNLAPLASTGTVESPVSEILSPIYVESVNPPDGEKPVLLVVEDNLDIATYIASCVQADFQIVWATDGQQGIDRALETVPDLILSDVMMPEKDGFQLCNELKSDPRTSHIPIVLLTARAGESDRLDGLRRGADAYLTKPFRAEELQLVLINLLQTRRRLQTYFSQLALQPAPIIPSAQTKSDSLEDQFLLTLRSLVEDELENPQLSIEDICKRMAMSRTTLHKKLVALTGMSTSIYVRALRLSRAKDLLHSSNLTISEIAYQVGFEDPKYFSRVFSDEFGVSPTTFRRSMQSEQ